MYTIYNYYRRLLYIHKLERYKLTILGHIINILTYRSIACGQLILRIYKSHNIYSIYIYVVNVGLQINKLYYLSVRKILTLIN